MVSDNNGMVMPVAPYGGYGNGFGNFGFGDGSWLAILFLFAILGGGWGMGGFGGFGGFGMETMMLYPYLFNSQTQNDVNRGFDNSGLSSQLSGIQNSVSNGFASAEVANCNRAMDAMQTAYTNQIADLNRSFDAQTANTAGQVAIQSQLAQCCCDNRLATQELQAVVQSENCADREALSNGVRDILTAQTASTQRILDKLCDQELQAERRENDNLRTQLNMANLAASQTAQTSRLLADNAAQTQQIENYVRPQINPAYIVPNPYAYNFPFFGYGNNGCCGNFGGFNGNF